jgi:hypothetical protein
MDIDINKAQLEQLISTVQMVLAEVPDADNETRQQLELLDSALTKALDAVSRTLPW